MRSNEIQSIHLVCSNLRPEASVQAIGVQFTENKNLSFLLGYELNCLQSTEKNLRIRKIDKTKKVKLMVKVYIDIRYYHY